MDIGPGPVGGAERYAAIGDLHADIDAHPFDIAPLLDWVERDEAAGDAPPEEADDPGT